MRNKMLELNINLDDPQQCLSLHNWFEACCLQRYFTQHTCSIKHNICSARDS